jgi:hypothetical protein
MAVKLSKNIRYLVRVRDYETVHVEVGAEADHHDLGWSDEDWAELKETRASWIDQLELLVITEVERLAREELQTIATWSEIEPNLAEDFLHSAPMSSAPIQRSQHAPSAKKTGSTPSSRRIRPRSDRSPSRTPPPAA